MADTEDKDFKEFCKALKTEPMDVEKIKEGIQKYGFRQLSDSQKALFQAAMFPKPAARGKRESAKLGFQDLKKINRTLRIVQELYSVKAIDKDEMLAFLTEPQRIPVKDADGNVSFHQGKSLLATVALHTYAIEFKDARFDRKLKQEGISDELRKDLTAMRKKLYENAGTATEIQTTLGKLDAEILSEAFEKEEIFNNGDENTGRRFKYNDLAKKSFIMKDNYEKAGRYAEQRRAEDTNTPTENTPEAVRFGGMPENQDTLTFSAQPENLNVSTNTPTPPTPPQTEDEDEKAAQLEKPDRDSKRGKSSFDFKPIAEQDLIKYLYNAWFLGLINFALKKAFNTTDKFIDYLCGDTGKIPSRTPIATRAPAPAPAAAGGQPPAGPTAGGRGAEEDTPLTPDAAKFAQQMIMMADLEAANTLKEVKRVLNDTKTLAAITECINANIGKDPDKWMGNADFNPLNHKAFIAQLNKSFFANKPLFRSNLAMMMKNPQILKELMSDKKIRLCAHLAAIDYVKNNPGKPLEGNAEAAKKIRKDTMIKFKDLVETTAQIAREKEIEFKHKNNLSPNAELSQKQQLAVANDTADAVSAYLESICISGHKLKDLLCEHHVTTDATQKKLLEQEIRSKQEEFDKLYNKYRSPDEEAQPTETRSKGKTEPMGVIEAAKDEQAGEKKQRNWESDIGAQKAQNAAEKAKNAQRKSEFKRRVEGNKQTRQTRVTQKSQESR